jgi:AbiU2
MIADLENRIQTLSDIMHQTLLSLRMSEFFIIKLRKNTFNANNNSGLHWITTILLEKVVMNLHKMFDKNGKCSFGGIINIAKNNKVKVDYDYLEKMVLEISDEYKKNDFKTLRDKFIAHSDIDIKEYCLNLVSLFEFTRKVENTFRKYFKAITGKRSRILRAEMNSLEKVFQ